MTSSAAALRLAVVGGRSPAEPELTAPLVENDTGEIVVRGWFTPPDGGIVVPGLATFRFSTGDDRVTAFAEPEAAHDDIVHSFYTTATPLVAWAVDGFEAIHASAVRHPAGVVTFCGPTGSGKTTLAHAFGASDYERFAEDALVFRADTDGVAAVALPFTVSLREPTRSHFDVPSLTTPAEVQIAKDVEGPLAAVILLDPVAVSASAPALERLSPSEAIVALLPNAYRFRDQPVERERRMLAAYLALVDGVAVYRLTYSKAFEQLETMCRSIVSTVTG